MQIKKGRKTKRRFLPRKAREKIEQKKIAFERIQILKSLVNKEPEGEFAGRYKELIKKIRKKYKIRLYKRDSSIARKNPKTKGF